MSAKKTCAACGKQIPDVAVVCVFCSAKQPTADPELGEPAAGAATAAATEAMVSKHATDPTLIGIKASDVQAALAEKSDGQAAAPAENGSNGASGTHAATMMADAGAPATATSPAATSPAADASSTTATAASATAASKVTA
ncbi:MAG TPA: hypothetical protein VF334_18085, partial [Polyangia bacterium]